ncbi:zinc finger MYM-type protein 1 [Tanacetum coccineum]
MSLLLRHVNVFSTCVTIDESFLGFLNFDETMGKRLFDITLDELKSLDLDTDDVHGQEIDNDSLTHSQAKSLATNELGNFKLLVAIVIWFEILYEVNLVSKKLQSNDMLIVIAIKEVKGFIYFFEKFREMGLSKSINDAKEIVVEWILIPCSFKRV